MRQVYPEAEEEQRCWNHKILNVLDKLPKRPQAPGTGLLRQIPAAPTRREAERRRDQFVAWCGQHGDADAARCLMGDCARLVPFDRFPQPHWQHLRSSNPVKSSFAAACLRTDAAKRFKLVKNAMAVIWKIPLVAEHVFRRVKHPEFMPLVYRAVRLADGQ